MVSPSGIQDPPAGCQATRISAGEEGSPSHRMAMPRRLEKLRQAWKPIPGIQQLSGMQGPRPRPRASAGTETSRERSGLSFCPIPPFDFPPSGLLFSIQQSLGKALLVCRTHSGKPTGRTKADSRPCGENGARHPFSLPGNHKDQPPSLATKWRLPLGPQNRCNSLVSEAVSVWDERFCQPVRHRSFDSAFCASHSGAGCKVRLG